MMPARKPIRYDSDMANLQYDVSELVINIDTGEFEIDADHLTASNRAAAKHPGAPLYAMRIGSPTLGRLGSRSRVAQHDD